MSSFTTRHVSAELLQLTKVPLQVEQQVVQQFATDWLARPLPAPARQQADQLQQLPQETLGLYVAPHPRINNRSLYKIEQRLTGARKVDVQRLVKQLQEQCPDAQQSGKNLTTSYIAALELGSGSCDYCWPDVHEVMQQVVWL